MRSLLFCHLVASRSANKCDTVECLSSLSASAHIAEQPLQDCSLSVCEEYEICSCCAMTAATSSLALD